MPVLRNNVELTQVIEWESGISRRVEDYLAAEEPLEIRIGRRPLTVTMRTPGHDRELAAGFLWTEGIVDQREQIIALHHNEAEAGARGNVVEVELEQGAFEPDEVQRNFFAASSCGICGKASIESIRNRGLRAPNPEFRVDPEVLCALPDRLRAAQEAFGRTGGLHAAGLFNAAGELLVIREDIGRHNAVDKVAGWALLSGLLPLSEHVLMVSGRGGFEIVQKALAAGVPVVASVSAPSSLAVRLARELNLTLIGFLRGSRFVVYAGQERCVPNAARA
ncbi:MAG TPA: formate dehydrogenase accessory sulfurtransferase FdhD [Terracidiphilus sp.]|nr:formate dehydrogenase accessory sulfurtransferase FdhD [Terracidiphilus sp.]